MIKAIEPTKPSSRRTCLSSNASQAEGVQIGASDHSSYQPQVSHSKRGSKVTIKEEQNEPIPNREKNKAKRTNKPGPFYHCQHSIHHLPKNQGKKGTNA
jgi:phosphatidate phosphatase PAH1